MRLSHTVLANLTVSVLVASASAQAEGVSLAAMLNADAAGSSTLTVDLRPEVQALVKQDFDQSMSQQRAAARAALVLQTMGDNSDVTPAELSRHLQLHLVTSFCLKRASQGSDAVRDSMLKKLKDKVLNTEAREKNYQRYQAAAKTAKLKLATDNDCAELDK